MNFVKMKHIQSGFYGVADYNCSKLYHLGVFLNAEISSSFSYNFFFNWLDGQYNQDRAYGNVYGLIEKDGRIYVCFQYDTEEEHFDYFNSTKPEILDIMNQWGTIFINKPLPTHILITEENGKVLVQPINE